MTTGNSRRDRAPNAASRLRRVAHAVAGVAMVSLAAVGLMIAGTDDPDTHSLWDNLLVEKKADAPFRLGGIALGMTPGAVRRIHPDMVIVNEGGGGRKGTYATTEGTFTVWFLGRGDGHKAFRVRYDNAFEDVTQDQIYDRMGRTYGQPAMTDCSANSLTGTASGCRFRWWTAGNVSVDVNSRTIKRGKGRVHTEFTLVAVDTYLAGKHLRARRNNGAILNARASAAATAIAPASGPK